MTIVIREVPKEEPKSEAIRFGYWVPNVSGGLVISKIAQRTDWDIGYNSELARTAERMGFDYALSQSRFTAGYGAEFQHEPMVFSQALLAATKHLAVIVALQPGPWTPAVAAKQIATLSHLYGGRIAVNVVSGWFRSEFAAIGEPWLDHDERYRRSEEFIRALRGIWGEDVFDFAGDFYRFHGYCAKPKPAGAIPQVFQGGSSCAARAMAARASDWYLTNGATPDELHAQVGDLRARAAAHGRCVKVGVNAFAIVRETADEARSVLAEIVDRADPVAVRAFGREAANAGKASPEGEGNWTRSGFDDLVQYNDGFRSNLIGTPCQVAERIMQLKDAGADMVLLGFLHFQDDLAHFGRTVIPLVRELERQRHAQLSPMRTTMAGGVAQIEAVVGGNASWSTPAAQSEPTSASLRAASRWTPSARASTRRATAGGGRSLDHVEFQVI